MPTTRADQERAVWARIEMFEESSPDGAVPAEKFPDKLRVQAERMVDAGQLDGMTTEGPGGSTRRYYRRPRPEAPPRPPATATGSSPGRVSARTPGRAAP